jgi:hypothetical protein
VVYVPRLVSVLHLEVPAVGALTLLHAASARCWERLVLASETCVTVTIPPKATNVATAATIRRLPLNQLLSERRFCDLRMVTPFSVACGGRWSRPG